MNFPSRFRSASPVSPSSYGFTSICAFSRSSLLYSPEFLTRLFFQGTLSQPARAGDQNPCEIHTSTPFPSRKIPTAVLQDQGKTSHIIALESSSTRHRDALGTSFLRDLITPLRSTKTKRLHPHPLVRLYYELGQWKHHKHLLPAFQTSTDNVSPMPSLLRYNGAPEVHAHGNHPIFADQTRHNQHAFAVGENITKFRTQASDSSQRVLQRPTSSNPHQTE